MSNLSNLVDESDDIFLQHLRANGELMDEAEAKDGVGLLPDHHRVKITTRTDVLTDNTRPSISEAQSQQVTNLLDRLLQDCSLHVLVYLFVVFAL